jgi:hypothetical protein
MERDIFQVGIFAKVRRIEQDGWDMLEIQDIFGPLEGNGFGRMGSMIYVTLRRKDTASGEATHEL